MWAEGWGITWVQGVEDPPHSPREPRRCSSTTLPPGSEGPWDQACCRGGLKKSGPVLSWWGGPGSKISLGGSDRGVLTSQPISPQHHPGCGALGPFPY